MSEESVVVTIDVGRSIDRVFAYSHGTDRRLVAAGQSFAEAGVEVDAGVVLMATDAIAVPQ